MSIKNSPIGYPTTLLVQMMRVHQHVDRPSAASMPMASRFNIDVGSSVPELRDESFGARIDLTNGVPIAIERSTYWNANGIFWAGGTNALGTPLP